MWLPATGTTLQAEVTVPAFDLEASELRSLQTTGTSISFDVPEGQEVITFRGRIAGRWMVGEGELGSVRYPFLLALDP